MDSFDLSRLKSHLDILRDEYAETTQILSLLNTMKYQDEIRGGMNRAVISRHIDLITKQQKYIQNRIGLLENTIDKIKNVSREVSDDLDDAIRLLLNCSL